MLKKITSILLAVSAVIILFIGCGAEKADSGKIMISATVFPAYDFARAVAGETAEVTLLVPPGSEVHSYEPTPKDLAGLNSCDLLLCNGGESEKWIETVLDGTDGGMNVLRMMDCVSVFEESDEGIAKKEKGEEDESEYDEHVWTSPVNAVIICEALSDELSAMYPEYAEVFERNAAEYIAGLKALDEAFRAAVEDGERNTIIFADRFPIRYFTEEYGLEYFAAFPGCAGETEPSAETVALMIDNVREGEIPAVFYIELSNEKMADIVCEETGCQKVLFHSCQSISADDFKAGKTYLDLMRGNVESITEALG